MINWLIYAAVATAKLPVETTDGGSIKTGVWATAGAVITLIGLFVANWGGWKTTAQAGREGDFARLRAEIDGYRAEINELQKRVDTSTAAAAQAVASAHAIQLQMVTLQAAFHLVAGELSRSEPDNPVLKEARDLVGKIAMTEEEIFKVGLRSLAQART